MPPIHRYACNECNFELPSGWGGYTYAVNDLGQRVVCPHPLEFAIVQRTTGLDYTEATQTGRVGYAQHCVCLNCLKQFDLDLERDTLVCPECSAPQVRSVRELVGQKCPRCKVGLIEEGPVVRWKLDPDWEQLPVPQVVKDLMEFVEQRRLPASLQRAAEVGGNCEKHNFLTVASGLLQWWEGDYFSEDQAQKDSVEIQPQRTWRKAFPAMMGALPALAELVVIRRGRCWFAEGVGPDVRRGIKNYLRKHRKHVLWS